MFRSALKRSIWNAAHLLIMILFTGPWRLLTKRTSSKCAMLMILMCFPSLAVCAVLTLPGLVFRSQQEHAYYYFALILENDPLRWIAFAMAMSCTLVSLAMPALLDRK